MDKMADLLNKFNLLKNIEIDTLNNSTKLRQHINDLEALKNNNNIILNNKIDILIPILENILSLTTENKKANQPNGNKPNGKQPNGNQPNGNQPNDKKPNGNKPNGNKPTAIKMNGGRNKKKTRKMR